MMRNLPMVLLMLLLSASAARGAQNSEDDKYAKFAKDAREWVWGMDLPQFNNRELPAAYKDESSVVLARYVDINMTKTRGVTFGQGLFSIDKGISMGKLVRQRIYINDEAALLKYSEYDYRSQIEEKWVGRKTNGKTAVGAKIIKPNGDVSEISTDEYTSIEDGNTKRTRMAIPGLEVGDVLDIFVYDLTNYENMGIDPIYISMNSEEPILDMQVHCGLDKRLHTRYRSYNGAPEMTESSDDDNYYLDLHTDATKKTPRRFYNDWMQTPYCVIKVFRKAPDYGEGSGIFKAPDAKPLIVFLFQCAHVKIIQPNCFLAPKPYKLIRKALKAHPEYNDKQKADVIDKVLTYCFNCNPSANEQHFDDFISTFAYYLRDNDIEFQIGVTTSKSSMPIDELLWGEWEMVIHVKDGDGYYTTPEEDVMEHEHKLPWKFQGQKAYFLDYGFYRRPGDDPHYEAKTLPEDDENDNYAHSEMKVKLDGTKVNIERRTQRKGSYKAGYQRGIATIFEIDSVYGKESSSKLSYTERYGEDRIRMIEYSRKTANSRFADEVEAFHDRRAEKVTGFSLNNIGIETGNPELDYTISYTLSGIVSKAGDDIAISVGQLVTKEKPLWKEERERSEDANFGAPGHSEHSIDIEIPEGYTVSQETLDAITMNVSNDCCGYKTTANVENGHIKIKVRKERKKADIAGADWQKMVARFDAEKKFVSSKIILTKKK